MLAARAGATGERSNQGSRQDMTEAVPPDDEGVVIPFAELSEEVLVAVIESFVLREGTDYGAYEYSLEQKVAHVRGQLTRGEAQIVFHAATEGVDIVPIRRAARARGVQ